MVLLENFYCEACIVENVGKTIWHYADIGSKTSHLFINNQEENPVNHVDLTITAFFEIFLLVLFLPLFR